MAKNWRALIGLDVEEELPLAERARRERQGTRMNIDTATKANNAQLGRMATRYEGVTQEKDKYRDIFQSEEEQEEIRKTEEAQAKVLREKDEQVSIEEVALDPAQVRELCKLSLDFLAATAMPTVYEFSFPVVLQTAWQFLVDGMEKLYKFPQYALGIPRGHAKTTLLKLFVLRCILFTDVKFILVVGSSDDRATDFLADIATMLSEPNIMRVFGDWAYARKVFRKDMMEFTFLGRNIVIAAMGQGGSLRGFNRGHQRPDLMIFEDVQTKECSESAIQSDSLLRWMIGTAMKAKSPRGCMFVFIGNMYPGTNSILRKLRTNKTWTKFISGAILADGTALWEDLRSLTSLIDEFNNDIEMGHPEIFLSEVMNDVDVGINTNVDISKIKKWPYTELDFPQGKFIIIDPSSGKRGRDNVAIGYFEVYDGAPGLRELQAGPISPGNTVRMALSMALKHGTRCIICEGTGYQGTLLYWFEEVTKQLGVQGFHFLEIYAGMKSKNARISNALKELTSDELYIHDSIRSQVIDEIANWQPMKMDNRDDILDLLGYAKQAVSLYAIEMTTDTFINIESGGVSDRVLDVGFAF